MKLLYIANPMCAWCYEFRDEIDTLVDTFSDLPIEVILSCTGKGRRITSAPRNQGGAVSTSGIEGDGAQRFVRSCPDDRSEVACKALIAARELASSSSSLGIFRWMQHAYFNNGIDISSAPEAADVTAMALNQQGYAVTPAQVLEVIQSAHNQDRYVAELDRVETWGIQKFPALVLCVTDRCYDVPKGANSDELAQELSMVMERLSSNLSTLDPLPESR